MNIKRIINYIDLEDNPFYRDDLFRPFIDLYFQNPMIYKLKLFHRYLLNYDRAIKLCIEHCKEYGDVMYYKRVIDSYEKTGKLNLNFKPVKRFLELFTYVFVGYTVTHNGIIQPLFLHYNYFQKDVCDICGFNITSDDVISKNYKELSIDTNIIAKGVKICFPDERNAMDKDILSLEANITNLSEYTNDMLFSINSVMNN